MTNDEQAVAPAWNTDEDEKPLYGVDRAAWRETRGGDGTVTEYASKTVMLQAGRRDNIAITEVVDRFQDDVRIPESVSVIKRSARYYGPELLVHDEEDGEDFNYSITCPGPGAHLLLWEPETETYEGRKMRSGWRVAAEIRAALAAEQPPYPECPECGELVRTIQHERVAAIGVCERAP